MFNDIFNNKIVGSTIESNIVFPDIIVESRLLLLNPARQSFFISLQRYAGLGFLFIFPKVPLNLHFLEFISEEVLVLREWNFYLIPRLGVFIGSMQTFILQSVCFFLIVLNYCLLQRMMRIGWVKLLLFQYPKVRTRAAK